MRIHSKVITIMVISLLALSSLPIFSVKTHAEVDAPLNDTEELRKSVEELLPLLPLLEAAELLTPEQISRLQELLTLLELLPLLEAAGLLTPELRSCVEELLPLLEEIQLKISEAKSVEELLLILPEIQPLITELISRLEELLPKTAEVFVVPREEKSYYIPALSNSTVANFNFNQPLKQISFDVDGPNGTVGFCAVMIENELLGGPYIVLVDGLDVTPTDQPTTGTHSFLYFTYNHSTHGVRIIGTTVIPEFTSAIIPPLLMITVAIAIMLRKKCLTKRRDAIVG